MITTTEERIYGNGEPDIRKRISWPSIWAGLLIGIVILILLNLLGLGVKQIT